MADVILLSGSKPIDPRQPRVFRTLGAYRIASELKKHGYTTAVIDYTQYMTADEVINALSKLLTPSTLWVGYSSTFFRLENAFGTGVFNNKLVKMYQSNSLDKITRIYNYIKANSSAKIVYGGAYALQAHADPRVDYYVAGYGDVAALELTNYLAGKDTLKHSQEIDIDGQKSILIDAGKYPNPAMDQLQTTWEDAHLLPGEAVPLELARGCIFKCKFCSYPLLGKKKGTYIRDMNEVRDEMIEMWERHGTDTYYITDDTFNDDHDKMIEFHKLMTSLPFKPKFACFLRLDLMEKYPEQAQMLLEAGLVGNFFGIESFNHASARAIGKGMHPDKLKNRLKEVRKVWEGKVNTSVGLIIGLPYDNDAYFKELWDYVHSDDYPVQHTSFNPLHIVDKRNGVNMYGSEFALNPEIYGYKFNKNGWYHEEQGLSFKKCIEIANKFTKSLEHKTLAPEFQVITYLATGVPLEDILKYTEGELQRMYNIPKMNNDKISMYKRMIGAV